MSIQTVTLLSDWGIADHYAAVVRGKLLSFMPGANVVDISHLVPRNDIYAAAYMAFDTYPYFPEGSIHIIGVDDIASPQAPHLVVRFDNHFFIGADNGFFSVLQAITGRNVQEIYEIERVYQESDVFTFPARDLFPKVAALLAAGTPFSEIGPAVQLRFKMLDGGIFLQRVAEKDREGNVIGLRLSGRVLHVDGFGNIVTNVTKTQFDACLKAYPFAELSVGWKVLDGSFAKAYMDVPEADQAFIFLENGFLEISVNRDNMAKLRGLNKNAKVNLRFGRKNKK